MTDRRKVLTQLAAGAAAVPAVALGATAQEHQGHARRPPPGGQVEDQDCGCARPGGPYAGYFPNVVVQTHEGRRALFYNDLLRGRTVLVNCMSVAGDPAYPVTANLVRAQRLLGGSLGRDVFIYSLTTDPENDTPRVLEAFAAKHGVRPGWLFLTAKPADLERLRALLFSDNGAHAAHRPGEPPQDCSLGLVRYGNEAVGLWGSVPAKAEPEWIVRRLSWVAARPAKAAGEFRRRGPSAPAAPARPPAQGPARRS